MAALLLVRVVHHATYFQHRWFHWSEKWWRIRKKWRLETSCPRVDSERYSSQHHSFTQVIDRISCSKRAQPRKSRFGWTKEAQCSLSIAEKVMVMVWHEYKVGYRIRIQWKAKQINALIATTLLLVSLKTHEWRDSPIIELHFFYSTTITTYSECRQFKPNKISTHHEVERPNITSSSTW